MFVKLSSIIDWARASQLLNSDLLRNHLLSFRPYQSVLPPRLSHHKMSQKVTHGHTPKFEVPLKCHTYRRLPSVSTYGSGVPLHCTFHVIPLKALPSKYSSTNSTRNYKVVIRLITQVRSLIVYASMGECNEEGIKTRCGPILTNTECLL